MYHNCQDNNDAFLLRLCPESGNLWYLIPQNEISYYPEAGSQPKHNSPEITGFKWISQGIVEDDMVC